MISKYGHCQRQEKGYSDDYGVQNVLNSTEIEYKPMWKALAGKHDCFTTGCQRSKSQCCVCDMMNKIRMYLYLSKLNMLVTIHFSFTVITLYAIYKQFLSNISVSA